MPETRERKRSLILAEHGGQVASAVQDADDFNDVRWRVEEDHVAPMRAGWSRAM